MDSTNLKYVVDRILYPAYVRDCISKKIKPKSLEDLLSLSEATRIPAILKPKKGVVVNNV